MYLYSSSQGLYSSEVSRAPPEEALRDSLISVICFCTNLNICPRAGFKVGWAHRVPIWGLLPPLSSGEHPTATPAVMLHAECNQRCHHRRSPQNQGLGLGFSPRDGFSTGLLQQTRWSAAFSPDFACTGESAQLPLVEIAYNRLAFLACCSTHCKEVHNEDQLEA